MAARKKSTRRSGGKSRSRGGIMTDTLNESLQQLERRAPQNLKPTVRQLRRGLRDLQKQLERARTERDARWNRIETQVRKELASFLRRVEKAVEPTSARRTTRKKASQRRKSSTSRKKSSRKTARRGASS